MNKVLCIGLLWFLSVQGVAQIVQEFVWPIDTPHVITGNYGELRPNHFHMGWDFSTYGKINYPVYAIANGYVSRIKVSSGGYGKALYILYPGNKLALYAHLNSYGGSIATIVNDEQHAKQSYEIELFPTRDEIMVKKGELVGYSGNSGNSTGPHLHFEIRNQETEVPLNLLEFYGFIDTIKPLVQQVAFYDLADTNRPVFSNNFKIKTTKRDSSFIQKDSVILNHAVLGFAFSGFDKFETNGNPNVIYSTKVFLDEQPIFSSAMNNISFGEQRYVNEFAETINKIKYQKCFLPTLYPQNLYENCFNKGRIVLTDTNYHLLRLQVNDENHNERIIQFYLKTRHLNGYKAPLLKGDLFVDCNSDFKSTKKSIQITMPEKTIYYSSPLFIENSLKIDGKFSILPAALNLGNAIKVGFLVPAKLLPKKEKMVLKNGAVVYNPSILGDTATYAVYALGHFQLAVDTIPPKIKTQLTPKKIKRTKTFESFSFVIQDHLSGVAKYHLYLNDTWVLAEFDAKSKLLTYVFDATTPTGNIKFRVEAEDRVGNHSEFKYVLKRR